MNKLYRKLAWINIKSNKHFYFPYLLTGIVSVMMFYCTRTMQGNEGLKHVRGGVNIITILSLGIVVIGFFISILLFYTNSFIMKRRKKELGIYNILGMEKYHIAKVMFWEILATYFISVGMGLLFGISFNKLLTMFLYRLTGLEESIPFYISKSGCLQTMALFGAIYLATFGYNFMKIQLSNPIELLRSSNTGEREPKTKILMTVIGVVCLGIAYYISITTEKPLEALTLFFVAVILVIIGTYCLFTAGSIAFLKILRKNKAYYYQTRHFTAVSGMIYRMKQNAVGLANICILSTMVLVMISTTISMYIGLEDELDSRYKAEMGMEIYFSEVPSKETRQQLLERIRLCIRENSRTILEETEDFSMGATGVWTENGIFFPKEKIDFNDDLFVLITVMTKENYEKISGNTINVLKEGEIAFVSQMPFTEDKIVFNQTEYSIAEHVAFPKGQQEEEKIYGLIGKGDVYLIVADETAFQEVIQKINTTFLEIPDRTPPKVTYRLDIDIDGTAEEKIACAAAIRREMGQLENGAYMYMESRQEGYADFLAINGALFFLGLFLGSMFLMVTVLIIYYKQISEGYEDKERFAIMQKVGMSRTEVKGAIRTQVQTVFFLPLAMAAIHLAAAFPMLKRLLAILNLRNEILFAWCLIGTVLLFGVIYLIVFFVTSRSYYKIVGEQ